MRLNRDHVRGAVTAIVWWAVVLCIWCLALALANVQACELQVMHGVPIYGSDFECSARTKFEGAKPDDVVVVPAGETVTLDRDATVLDVLVRGHLHIEPGVKLDCRTFTVAGMSALCTGHDFTLTIRDLPIDTVLDPQQWGHGVLALDGGRIEWESPNYRDTHAPVTASMHAGDSEIEFGEIPHGWVLGDTLLFPDLRQPDDESELGKQNETRTIGAIDFRNGIIGLNEPLKFDHLSYVNGDVVVHPDVANLVQPIKFLNENKNQNVPGHISHIGSGQLFLQGVDSEWGRTTTAEIDNSRKLEDGSWYIGKNQIARYGLFHAHHCYGKYGETRPWQGAVRHSVSRHSPKWGVSIHQSHWQLCEDVLVYDAAGCGIVTEEELSSNFKIHDCMVVAQQPGSGLRITSDHGGRGHRNDPTGDFWHNRGGLGLSSVMGEVTGNRLYCCTEPIGMAGAFGGPIVLYNPIERGVPLLSKSDPNSRILASHMGYVDGEPTRYPFGDTSGNIVWSGHHGIESWTAHSFEGYEKFFPGLTLIHCNKPVLIFDHHGTVFDHWRVLGDPSKSHEYPDSFAIDFKDDYRFGITALDCELRHYDAAYRYVNDSHVTRFTRCTVECPIAMYVPEGPSLRLGTTEREVIWEDTNWIGDPTFCVRHWNQDKYAVKWRKNVNVNGSNKSTSKTLHTYLRPWKDGKDYEIFQRFQRPGFALEPIQAPDWYDDWTPGVWSQQQLAELGTPIYGGVVPLEAEDWGAVYAAPEDCCVQVERLRARIRELEGR